jgi:phenylacetate-CoA ligase
MSMRTMAEANDLRRSRFRRVCGEWSELIEESERWSRDRLETYALVELQSLLHYAYEHVPYYRSLFQELGANPEDIHDLRDLQLLPTLGKRELQEHKHGLLAKNISPRDRIYATTAGSTGEPVGFFQHKDTQAKEWAFMTAQWRRVGYRRHDRAAILRGSALRPGRLFQLSAKENALLLSSYHLTEDRLPLYVERLRAFRPRFLRAYPSSAALLAQFMLERGEPPIEGVTAVLCGSENLYDWQREAIEEAFQCRVFSWYGQSERVCLAGECEHSTTLHVFPQYGIAELLGRDGKLVDSAGQPGEIVATGLLDRTMPLIRYRTADVAIRGTGTCQACGRPYDVLERIEGRLQEFIVGSTGRYVSMTAINMHSPVFDNVHQFRFRQSVRGRVVLAVVPKKTYRPRFDEAGIRAELGRKLGPDFKLEIEAVKEISRSGRGKFRFLDQELPGPFDPQ